MASTSEVVGVVQAVCATPVAASASSAMSAIARDFTSLSSGLRTVDLLPGHQILELTDPEEEQRPEYRREAGLQTCAEALVFAQEDRAARFEIGALQGGQFAVPLVHRSFRR